MTDPFVFTLSGVSRLMMRSSMNVKPMFPAPVLKAGEDPLLLYIHIPFCEEICPYCSFFKEIFNAEKADEYFDAVESELTEYSRRGFVFDEIYVGGGTPTVLHDRLGSVLDLAGSLWNIKDISVETNPDHLTPEILGVLKKSGVTRLSVGVQTFDEGLLKSLNRYNKYGSGEEIKSRLKAAAGIFQTLNIDLIFNFPGQSAEMVQRDIAVIRELEADQVTYYPLMSSSSVSRRMTSALGSYSTGGEYAFYKQISAMLADEYERTTAWCFTRKGNMADEYIINREHYMGAGAGSFSYLPGGLFASTFSIREYINLVKAHASTVSMGRTFSGREKNQYSLLMALFGGRLDFRHFSRANGRLWTFRLIPELLFLFLSNGIRFERGGLTTTERGRYYTVVLMREFFIKVNNIREQCRLGADRPGAGLPG